MVGRERAIEEYARVLVVEGYSDLLFYAEVLELVGKLDQVYIKELGGRAGDQRKKLEAFITPTLLERKSAIAFVMDADDAPETTRKSLQGLLSRLTHQTVVEGEWTSGTPRIGLIVVPGGRTKGEVETLIWQAWSSDPANQTQRKCVEDYIACMRSNGATPRSADKGLIGALLAVRHDEDPRLGPGARAKIFDLRRPQLTPLCKFLGAF